MCLLRRKEIYFWVGESTASEPQEGVMDRASNAKMLMQSNSLRFQIATVAFFKEEEWSIKADL
jgi:hypothetical protein